MGRNTGWASLGKQTSFHRGLLLYVIVLHAALDLRHDLQLLDLPFFVMLVSNVEQFGVIDSLDRDDSEVHDNRHNNCQDHGPAEN